MRIMKKLFLKLQTLPLKRKFIYYAVLLGLMFFAVIFVLLANLHNVSAQLDRINALGVELSEADACVRDTHQKLISLITYAPEERVQALKGDMSALIRRFAQLKIPAYDYDTYYLLGDTRNMLETYRQHGEMLVKAIVAQDYADMGNVSARLDGIAENILLGTSRLSIALNEQVSVLAQRIARQLDLFKYCLPGFAICFVAYAVLFFIRMDRRFIGPIYQLVGMAQQISDGNYPSEKLRFDEEKDFNLLSDTMFNMSRIVRENIEDISKRARMAQELNEKKIENLRIKTMYNQLELRRLQEQINPHFLFNCMSTLHHTAYLDGAERTCEICSAISDLLRYNFKQSDASVTLASELRNVADYTYVQSMRFGSRISIQTDIEPEASEVVMPRMVLQPIVENCYNHGLANCMSGGEIRLTVARDGARVRVSICDNGCGMPQEKIDTLMALFNDPQVNIEDHAHVGMLNVVKRLQSYYRRQDVIELNNADGLNVTLFLYLE